MEWREAVDCGINTGRPLESAGRLLHPIVTQALLPEIDLIGLEWGPDFSIFKSSPGNSNVHLGLRTFAVDDTVRTVIIQAKTMIYTRVMAVRTE